MERSCKDLPRQVLPFALGGGDAILLHGFDNRGRRSRVVVFLEGLPAWAGLRQESAFIEVAPSFGAFIHSLRVDKSYCIECLQDALKEGNAEAVRYNVEFLNLALPGWRDRYPSLAEGVQSAQ